MVRLIAAGYQKKSIRIIQLAAFNYYYYYYYYYPHFNGLFFRTTWVSQYQKGKSSLDLNEARDDGFWGRQWHQLDNLHLALKR